MTSVAAANPSGSTKSLVRTALAVALMYIALLAVQLSPTGDAFFFTLAATVLMAVVLLNGWLHAFLAFLALAILGFFTLSPALIWPFFLAYGLWVFIKLGIEFLCFSRRWPLWKDYALKFVSAFVLTLIAYFLLSKLMLGQAFTALNVKAAWINKVWPLALIILIMAYDYFLSVAKSYLVRELFPHLN